MNCEDVPSGEDWGDVTDERRETLELVVDTNLRYSDSPVFLLNSRRLKPDACDVSVPMSFLEELSDLA